MIEALTAKALIRSTGWSRSEAPRPQPQFWTNQEKIAEIQAILDWEKAAGVQDDWIDPLQEEVKRLRKLTLTHPSLLSAEYAPCRHHD